MVNHGVKNKWYSFLLLLTVNISYGQINPLVFNFDTIESVFIDTALSNNVWQIGKPQKTFFDSSYTYPNAILTDTINSYPSNTISQFIVKTPTYINSHGGVNMRFLHKFDTDSLEDGGVIYVSVDGINWTTLITSPAFVSTLSSSYPGNDTITSLQDIGFSGRSSNWQPFDCYWNYPPTDTLWIQFKFASDSIQTFKEGWMIDSLVFSYDLGIGINETGKASTCGASPNPFHQETTLTFLNPEKNAVLFLFNANGHMIQRLESLTGNQITLTRGSLTPGLYLFVIWSGTKITAKGKLVAD